MNPTLIRKPIWSVLSDFPRCFPLGLKKWGQWFMRGNEGQIASSQVLVNAFPWTFCFTQRVAYKDDVLFRVCSLPWYDKTTQIIGITVIWPAVVDQSVSASNITSFLIFHIIYDSVVALRSLFSRFATVGRSMYDSIADKSILSKNLKFAHVGQSNGRLWRVPLVMKPLILSWVL